MVSDSPTAYSLDPPPASHPSSGLSAAETSSMDSAARQSFGNSHANQMNTGAEDTKQTKQSRMEAMKRRITRSF